MAWSGKPYRYEYTSLQKTIDECTTQKQGCRAETGATLPMPPTLRGAIGQATNCSNMAQSRKQYDEAN